MANKVLVSLFANIKALMPLFYPLVVQNSFMHVMMGVPMRECHTCACHLPDRRLGTAVVTFRILENTRLHDSGIYTHNTNSRKKNQ